MVLAVLKCALVAIFLLVVRASKSGSLRGGTVVTPVEEVIKLLKNLQGKIEDEGKTEAAQYDKFACFCKEQADDKLYAVEKSTEKIAKLTALIEKLDAEINDLTTEASHLDDTMDSLKQKMKEASDAREKEHSVYKEIDAGTQAALAALKNAIQAMKDSKIKMSGAKVDLVEVLSKALPKKANTNAIALLSKLHGGQSPPSYEYKSNDIISTLQTLHDAFLTNKKEADEEEFHAQAAFDKSTLGMKNQHSFAGKNKVELEQTLETKSGELSAAREEQLAETNAKDADQSFLDVLTTECEEKATQWDQRSKSRAGELTAIGTALESLEKGASPSYSANKKLVDVQLHKFGNLRSSKRSGSFLQKLLPASFLQLGGSRDDKVFRRQRTATALRSASRVLTDAGRRLGSVALTSLAVRMQDDPFVKVRQLIKDMVTKLENDASEEADRKAYCDSAMSQNIQDRDKFKADSEKLLAESSLLEAESATLAKEIASLGDEISKQMKALNEATELRALEKAENEETIATATEGKDAVQMALKVLADYYGSQGAFLQYTPPDSDREGKTVADRAPEIWEGQYEGKQADSKGVMGLLEVILSDFERTISTVTEEETQARTEFDEFKNKANGDIADMTTLQTEKTSRSTEVDGEIMDTSDALKQAQERLKLAEEALAELKKTCVDAEESYEERVTRREQEIAALKEAMAILEDIK